MLARRSGGWRTLVKVNIGCEHYICVLYPKTLKMSKESIECDFIHFNHNITNFSRNCYNETIIVTSDKWIVLLRSGEILPFVINF